MSSNDFISQWEAEEQRRRDALPARKAAILKLLRAAGIASVDITYDGEGDEGQIDSITAADAAGERLPKHLTTKVRRGKSLHEELDEFAWDLIQAHHEGFHNDSGGYGQITINVAAGTVTLDHNDRVTDYVNTTTEV